MAMLITRALWGAGSDVVGSISIILAYPPAAFLRLRLSTAENDPR